MTHPLASAPPEVTTAPAPHRPWWRRRSILTGGVVLIIVIVASAVLATLTSPAPTTSPALPPATTAVVTADLVATKQVTGTLSYGEPVGLIDKAGPGTLTWVASDGAVIGLGQPMYTVDDDPVVLIHGTIPSYRDLKPGDSGADVAQLESSLAALGFGGFDVDDTFTASTSDVVKLWQAQLGEPVTGVVSAGDVVVAPGDIRIAVPLLAPGTELGTEPNQTVLTYSGTTRKATIALDVADQYLVTAGQQATITLPGGSTVAGTVSTIGTAAQTDDPQGGSKPITTITVVVDIADQQALGRLDSAPVGITLVTGSRQNVLAVPVTALVALLEGGHGVQVVEGDQVHYVPVQTGLFAAGKVEINGPGITEGTLVGVPA